MKRIASLFLTLLLCLTLIPVREAQATTTLTELPFTISVDLDTFYDWVYSHYNNHGVDYDDIMESIVCPSGVFLDTGDWKYEDEIECTRTYSGTTPTYQITLWSVSPRSGYAIADNAVASINGYPATCEYDSTYDHDNGVDQPWYKVTCTITPNCNPPVITAHPQNVTVQEGQNAVFSVTATGDNLHYQWQQYTSSWADVSGATAVSYSVTATTNMNGRRFRCKVSNANGEVYSNAATLNVYVPDGVPVNAANFPDANFRSLVSSDFDTDHNGYLSDAEIAAATEMYVYGEIHNLQGIEYFTALEYLDCTENYLTTLDLSANTALTELDCYNNELTSLNVSGCTALKFIYCAGNQLTSLDISGCPALTTLYCSHNQLTTLDVSHNPALTELLCLGNSISTLDISACPELVNIYLNGTHSEQTSGSLTYDRYLLNNHVLGVDKTTTVVTGKPTITTQPKSQTAAPDTTVKFTVGAEGEDLSYQWYYRTSSTGTWNTTSLTGNKTATLTVKATEARNGYQYRCKVSNAAGYVYSNAATLTVTAADKPTITTQPADKSGYLDSTVKFTVKADGGDLTYQWYYRTSANGTWKTTSLTGNKTATLSVKVTEARNGYQYRCKVSNAAGYKYSSAATLTVKTKITTQPADKNLAVGKTAKFTVAATGVGLTYQWYYRTGPDGTWKTTSLTGNKTATLSVPVTAARNGYQYRVKITNANGKYTYSNAATLTVKTTITTQPKSVTKAAGKTAKFTVEATGAGLTYQWYYRTSSTGAWKTTSLTGNKTATLSVTATTARNGYQYRVKITDANGKVTYSSAATLTVTG